MAVVRFCLGGHFLRHFIDENLMAGLGQGQAGVGVLQLIGGFVDGAFEVGVFLAKAGEVGLKRGELQGLLRRRDGGESLLKFGVLEDDIVVQSLDPAL